MSSPRRQVLSLKRDTASQASKLSERLHKVLANAGLGSRRALEERIRQGDVIVNDEVAIVGATVSPGDQVILDSRRFVVTTDSRENTRLIIFNKPEGMLVTRDHDEDRPVVYDHLPEVKNTRWVAVGRLDINTTGLLLLTTDGDLANALMHPSSGLVREYLCRIHGTVPPETLEVLQQGVMLEDGEARFDHIEVISQEGSHSWFKVCIHEGRNREVRRLWDSQGFLVSRLKRIRYGNVILPRALKRGEYQELDEDTVKALRTETNMDASVPRLTVAPIARQRRMQKHFKPAHKAVWSGSYQQDEARELRAFDHIGNTPRKPSGKKYPSRSTNGNSKLRDPSHAAHKGGGRRKKRIAPGQELPSVRSWFAGSQTKDKANGSHRSSQQTHNRNAPRKSGRSGRKNTH